MKHEIGVDEICRTDTSKKWQVCCDRGAAQIDGILRTRCTLTNMNVPASTSSTASGQYFGGRHTVAERS